MLTKTKQNKNGNLVCLASLSGPGKQTSSQKDKHTHTHSKRGEGLLAEPATLQAWERRRELSQQAGGSRALQAWGPRTEHHPAVGMSWGEGPSPLHAPTFKGPGVPPSKLIHVQLPCIWLCSPPPLALPPAARHWWPRVKWKHSYPAYLPLLCHVRHINTQTQTLKSQFCKSLLE